MLDPKVEISREGFLELFFHYNRQIKSMRLAYEKAVSYCEEIGLPCRFKSYDGFRKNVLAKGKVIEQNERVMNNIYLYKKIPSKG